MVNKIVKILRRVRGENFFIDETEETFYKKYEQALFRAITEDERWRTVRKKCSKCDDYESALEEILGVKV